jgi:hypothetical protein
VLTSPHGDGGGRQAAAARVGDGGAATSVWGWMDGAVYIEVGIANGLLSWGLRVE